MELQVKRHKNFPSFPVYAEELADFVLKNSDTPSLLDLFCRVIDAHSSYATFQTFELAFISQFILEADLLRYLSRFYHEANKAGNLDNQRGDLLELIINKALNTGRHVGKNTKYSCILSIIDGSSEIGTTSPYDVDFHVSAVNNDCIASYESKVKVNSDKVKITALDKFANLVKANGLVNPVSVVHCSTQPAMTRVYGVMYPDLHFIGPEIFRAEFF